MKTILSIISFFGCFVAFISYLAGADNFYWWGIGAALFAFVLLKIGEKTDNRREVEHKYKTTFEKKYYNQKKY